MTKVPRRRDRRPSPPFPAVRSVAAVTARIVIRGAGTGGTTLANRLARVLPDAAITVVDRDDRQVRGINTVGEFYEQADVGQTIFT